jgi:uncharacterized protein (TIGR02145 family)
LLCIMLSGFYEQPAKDFDGYVYKTVTIGKQVWMAENLKTLRYRNGDLIGTTFPSTIDISEEVEPKYQWAFGGDEGNVPVHGRLYTWHAATDSRNLCPTGWHLPSHEEWILLTTYLTDNSYGSRLGYCGMDIAKSLATKLDWRTDSSEGAPGNDQYRNNSTGFSALPSGCRQDDGKFLFIGEIANWWSDTKAKGTFVEVGKTVYSYSPDGDISCAYFHNIYHDYGYVNSYINNTKYGFSVRCLRNN